MRYNLASLQKGFMVFPYYQKLNAAQKLVYRKSDEITSLPLPDAFGLQPLIAKLEQVLIHEDRTKIEDICLKISSGILERFAYHRLECGCLLYGLPATGESFMTLKKHIPLLPIVTL
jgi:hypothetical protein